MGRRGISTEVSRENAWLVEDVGDGGLVVDEEEAVEVERGAVAALAVLAIG